MPILKLWSSDHKQKKAVSISELNINNVLEKAQEKNIFGSKIFLLDGTEVDGNEILEEFKNEILVISDDGLDVATSQVSHTTASDITLPNSPASSISSNVSDGHDNVANIQFEIPYNKLPSNLLLKLNNDVPISTSEITTLVRTVTEELVHKEKLPRRSIYRAIARELCDKFPQLYDRDADTKELIGTGYYTIFKKIEERVHYLQRPNKIISKTSGLQDDSITSRRKLKRLKNLGAGCKEWQPINEENENSETLENKKTWLKSVASIQERDEYKVELYMKYTYSCQRSFLNSSPAVTAIAEEWPVLLQSKYMIRHFERLCALDTSKCVDIFFSKTTDITRILRKNDADQNIVSNYDLLILIAKYFKEDLSHIYQKYEEPLTQCEIAERVKTTSPNIIFSDMDNIFYLLVENRIISETASLSSSMQLLFAAYYNFNMEYPVACQNTLEFIQRFVFKINPAEGSKVRKERTLSKVLSLIKKLN